MLPLFIINLDKMGSLHITTLQRFALFFVLLFVHTTLFGQIPDVPTPLCHYCGNPLPQDPVSTSNPDYARIHHKTTCPYYPKSDTEQTYVNQGPTQQELDAYYNQQWTDQLSQQADIDFRKGMKAFNEGNCEKAVRHLNMARKMVSLKIYEDAYQAAVACKEKGTLAQKPKEDPKPVVSNKPTQVTTAEPTTSTNGRRRNEPATNAQVQSNTLTAAVAKEQKAMETNTETWVEYQKRQFKIRIEQPNYWCKNYVNVYDSLIALEKANKPYDRDLAMKLENYKVKNKTLDNLNPGDVLLFSGTKIATVNNMVIGSNKSTASHTLTYLKEVDGKKLFLDCQYNEGPRIIDEKQLDSIYKDRSVSVAQLQDMYVASPLNKAEAEKLYEKALVLDSLNKVKNSSMFAKLTGDTGYGIAPGNIVCSEASYALLKTAGRDIPLSKIWSKGSDKPVGYALQTTAMLFNLKFTPADFYEYNQYFLITPIDIKK